MAKQILLKNNLVKSKPMAKKKASPLPSKMEVKLWNSSDGHPTETHGGCITE